VWIWQRPEPTDERRGEPAPVLRDVQRS